MEKAQSPFVIGDDGRFSVLRLVDTESVFHDSITVEDALKMADELGLDLVCFADSDSKSPLCKLIDFGKWKYIQDKKRKKMQKVQKHHDKEVRFTPLIGDHDVEHKVKQIRQLITHDCDVTISMRMKRNHHRVTAREKLNGIVEQCSDFSSIVSQKDTKNSFLVRISKKKEKGERP